MKYIGHIIGLDSFASSRLSNRVVSANSNLMLRNRLRYHIMLFIIIIWVNNWKSS